MDAGSHSNKFSEWVTASLRDIRSRFFEEEPEEDLPVMSIILVLAILAVATYGAYKTYKKSLEAKEDPTRPGGPSQGKQMGVYFKDFSISKDFVSGMLSAMVMGLGSYHAVGFWISFHQAPTSFFLPPAMTSGGSSRSSSFFLQAENLMDRMKCFDPPSADLPLSLLDD